MKRGFELQFHWIFVLIAGGLIVGFFFFVANKQRTISTEKLSLTLSSEIENVLTSAFISAGTSQILPIPPQGIAFECSEGCDCVFRISRASRPFGGKSIFAPSFLKDQDLIVWSTPWNVPFHATNFLFITNPLIKYYFIYNPQDQLSNSFFYQLEKTLPYKIVKEFIPVNNINNIKNEGYELSRFVFLNINPTNSDLNLDSSFEKVDVSAVSIGPSDIYFYTKIKRTLEFTPIGFSSYAGFPMVLAAVFANDNIMYECNIKSAFKRLSHVSALYSSRAQELQSLADAQDKLCIYSPSINMLNEQAQSASALAFNVNPAALANFPALVDNLDRANRDVIEQSCPELF